MDELTNNKEYNELKAEFEENRKNFIENEKQLSALIQ